MQERKLYLPRMEKENICVVKKAELPCPLHSVVTRMFIFVFILCSAAQSLMQHPPSSYHNQFTSPYLVHSPFKRRTNVVRRTIAKRAEGEQFNCDERATTMSWHRNIVKKERAVESYQSMMRRTSNVNKDPGGCHKFTEVWEETVHISAAEIESCGRISQFYYMEISFNFGEFLTIFFCLMFPPRGWHCRARNHCFWTYAHLSSCYKTHEKELQSGTGTFELELSYSHNKFDIKIYNMELNWKTKEIFTFSQNLWLSFRRWVENFSFLFLFFFCSSFAHSFPLIYFPSCSSSINFHNTWQWERKSKVRNTTWNREEGNLLMKNS